MTFEDHSNAAWSVVDIVSTVHVKIVQKLLNQRLAQIMDIRMYGEKIVLVMQEGCII